MNFRTTSSALASAAEIRFRVDGGNRLQNRLTAARVRRFSFGSIRPSPEGNTGRVTGRHRARPFTNKEVGL